MAKGIDGRVDRIFSRLDGFFDRLFDVHYDKPDAYEGVEVYEPTAPSGTVAAEPKLSEELFGGYSMPKLESSSKPGLLARLLPKQLFAYLEKIYGTKMDEMSEAYIGLASLYNANMNEMLPIYNELARLYSSFEPQKTKDTQTGKEQPNAQAPEINPDIDTKQASAMIFETLDLISEYQEKQNKKKLEQ